jgi:hypothetical protein
VPAPSLSPFWAAALSLSRVATTPPNSNDKKNEIINAMTKTKKKAAKSSKSDKAQLAAGADDIRKAEKEAKDSKAIKPELKNGKGNKAKKVAEPPMELVVIPESTRPIEEILKERVTVLPGSTGLELADATPIEESLRVLDWAMQMSNHVGFFIGDVLNFGEKKWGDKYTAALTQTGLARTTLEHYAWVAKNTPAEKRRATLTFSHHEVVVPLLVDSPQKAEGLLDEAEKQQAKTGSPPTVRELRVKVRKLKPKKVKKVTSGKGKKRKAKPEPPPYEPPPDEQAKLDMAEDALKEVNTAIKNGKVEEILLQCDNGEKRRWTETLLLPVFELYQTVVRHTGY